MLALEVAAGIVLAYVIIVNQQKLLAFGKGAITTVLALGFFALVIWGVMSSYQAAHDRVVSPEPLPAWASKLLTVIGLIPVFILFVTASTGLLLLIGLVMRRTPKETWKVVSVAINDGEDTTKGDDKGCLALMFGAGLLMFAVNYALSWPVFAVTPLGAWSDELYRYGMTTEWKDGLQILFFAVLWQWPWIPLGIYFLVRRLKGRGETL